MAARGESAAIEEGTRDTECPVCYECFGDTERTLSCGHVFCHDCLVKTLVSVSRDGLVKRENIICPICRHLTFICRRDALVAATTAGKGEGEEERAQTLEVPVPMSAGAPQHLFGDQDLTSPPANAGPSRAARFTLGLVTLTAMRSVLNIK
ncbi:hypothetical protein AAFF_G00199290 [Aldrovandia affinis]|uniref:RING-type domain-containing protein n=1 Tax=Aldrovandia affinis TaxID=143900 RepID=A0AAD7RID4_9TELE|nr:hypothetical protein AAFF_G00199290 [Aldrovandia affinis]